VSKTKNFTQNKNNSNQTTEGAAIRNHNHNEIRNGSQASDEHGKAHAPHKNSNKTTTVTTVRTYVRT
jgi:hypothetical protein